jgi:zinc-ribbon domain
VSFNVLTIRSGLDSGNDALYPVLSDATAPEIIALDRYDGPNAVKVVATSVRVLEAGSSLKTLVKLNDVKIDIYITDGRVALACEKYDKGGGWVGFGGAGVLVAVTANAVSKAMAAKRSRGKVLVGHVRYPWLRNVGATSKSSFVTAEAIRLEYAEKLPSGVVRKMLELTLPKNIDATLVAQEITRRAAAFRLANYPGMSVENRAKYASLCEAPPRVEPPPKKFAFVPMPTFFYVNAATAFPRQSQPGGPGQPDESTHTTPGEAGESSEPVPARDYADAGVLAESATPAQPIVPGQATGPAVPGRGRHASGMAQPGLSPGYARPRHSAGPAGTEPAYGGAINGHATTVTGTEMPGAPQQAANFCSQCGTRVVAGDNFCMKCGAPLDNGPASYPGNIARY